MTTAQHDDTWVEEELVEAEAAAEALAAALVSDPPHGSPPLAIDVAATARDLEDTLRKTARSLRLAVVAEADGAMVSRLRLRLQMAIGQAWSLVDSRAHAPASQRPTLPPGLGSSPEEVWSSLGEDARLTLPPPPSFEPTIEMQAKPEKKTSPWRAVSGVRAKIHPPRATTTAPTKKRTG